MEAECNPLTDFSSRAYGPSFPPPQVGQDQLQLKKKKNKNRHALAIRRQPPLKPTSPRSGTLNVSQLQGSHPPPNPPSVIENFHTSSPPSSTHLYNKFTPTRTFSNAVFKTIPHGLPPRLLSRESTQFSEASMDEPGTAKEGSSEAGPVLRPSPRRALKYGDVFDVRGELAREPIAPRDAAMMQSAENLVMGQTQKGGPAAVMQSAARRNEHAGLVGHRDVSDLPADEGVAVTETDLPGRRVVTESVGRQVVGRFETPEPVSMTTPAGALQGDAFSIGEALEATAMTLGQKPVDQADAAAIQAAEVRATGLNEVLPGGVAAEAQSAADANAGVTRDADKVKLRDVLADATTKLPADKAVTREDAERVAGAEVRNKPDMATHPQGVAANVAAAARLNQNRRQF